MKRLHLACLIAPLFMVACPGPGEDGDDTTGLTGGISLASEPTTSDGESGGFSSGSGGPGGESSGEPGSTTEIVTCGIDEIAYQPKIPRVMLVLDKSGSMIANPYGFWDADGDDLDDDGLVDGDPATPATPKVTRWRSLHETVEFIVGGFEARMDFGATLFPALDATKDYDGRACKVQGEPDVAVGPDQGALILESIPPADTDAIRGGTPAAAGILTGIAGLSGLLEGNEKRPPYLILVTDGAANCPLDPSDPDDGSTLFEEYDEQLPLIVAEARTNGIPTFVVGIDIEDATSPVTKDGNPDATNTFEKLNEVAVAGGMARDGAERFYNTRNQFELQTALMKISEIITSCTFELNKPLLDIQKVESLTVNPGVDPHLVYGEDQVADCDGESGWRFTDEDRGAIELCGAACDLYKQTGQVEIVFECIIP